MPADLTESEARESVATAKRGLEAAADEIVRQIGGRAWVALGYADWDQMREAEYRGAAVIVPRAGRPEIVARLREEGLSQKQIGETLGVDQKTVSNDVRNIPNVTPVRTDSLGRQQPTSKPRPAAVEPLPEAPLVEQQPSPRVAAWLESDQSLQDSNYMQEFTRALHRSQAYLEFDAERIGSLSDDLVMRVIDDLVISATEFANKARKARSGLRVIKGDMQ